MSLEEEPGRCNKLRQSSPRPPQGGEYLRNEKEFVRLNGVSKGRIDKV